MTQTIEELYERQKELSLAGCLCNDCGTATMPKSTVNDDGTFNLRLEVDQCESFMLHADLWLSFARDDEILCLACTEKRLGRRLAPYPPPALAVDETAFNLAKFEAERAKVDARDAKAAAATAKVSDEIASLRQEQERIHKLAQDAAEGVAELSPTEPQALASRALGLRAQQLEAELQVQIDDLTTAAPFVAIPDLGSYEVAREIRDPETGLVTEPLRDADTGEKIYPTGFKTADGEIGRLVRELEDATAAHKKILETYPKQSLRAQDVFEKLSEAKARVEAATAEAERRQRDERRNERVTELASEYALAAATQVDEETRKALLADTEMDPEEARRGARPTRSADV